ncbi:GGDEF domain-containing protein [Thiomicrorhabdus aquaedulcis]|uniref:GGDEF domain-containing protein n=1 Tax=Thiomicrorhabdus aquaedulcis TaxID=2211106 RepID=UPI000FD814D7|nr:GGDEF domain-containing protein [Thiomicrorhabdus aquaedulcis]
MAQTNMPKTQHQIIERFGASHSDKNLPNLTLSKINALKLNANPIHYTLIYELLSRADPYFTEEISNAIEFNNYNDQTAQGLFIELITNIIHKQIPTEEVGKLLNGLLNDIENWVKRAQSKQLNLRDEMQHISEHNELPASIAERLRTRIFPALDEFYVETSQLQQQVSASAIEIKQLKDELEQATSIAKTDELTNIPNRRGFNEIIQRLKNKALQEQATFALIILDIDHFKKVNDIFGHLIGDSVLRYIAKLLKEETKGRDSVARIGGEEFVVLLPNTHYGEALKVANNLRLKVNSKTLSVKNNSTPLSLSISAGVAMYQMDEDIESLIHRADLCLYKAKNSGRNKVCGEAES